MSKRRNPRFQVTLPEIYYQMLEQYAKSISDTPAAFAAYAIQKELDKLQEAGKIDLTESLNEANEEKMALINFVKTLTGEETEADLETIAQITGIAVEKLQQLQKKHFGNN